MYQKNRQFPRVKSSYSSLRHSLPWTSVISPLGFWQMGAVHWTTRAQGEWMDELYFVPTFPFNLLCWAGYSLALSKYLLFPHIYGYFHTTWVSNFMLPSDFEVGFLFPVPAHDSSQAIGCGWFLFVCLLCISTSLPLLGKLESRMEVKHWR